MKRARNVNPWLCTCVYIRACQGNSEFTLLYTLLTVSITKVYAIGPTGADWTWICNFSGNIPDLLRFSGVKRYAHKSVLFHFLVQGDPANSEGIGSPGPAVTGVYQGSLNTGPFRDFAVVG